MNEERDAILADLAELGPNEERVQIWLAAHPEDAVVLQETREIRHLLVSIRLLKPNLAAELLNLFAKPSLCEKPLCIN